MSISNQMPMLIERFYHWESTTPDKVFLRQPKGENWKDITFAQAGREARKLVSALQTQGLKTGDHIGLYSKNCCHWIIADLAILMGGFVSVPFYSSLPGPQLAEVIKLGDLKAIFVGKLDYWDDTHDKAVSGDLCVINFPHYQGNTKVSIGLEWEKLIEEHEPVTKNFIPEPDDLWTIKFTSGTTGTPKGVMHIHRTPALYMLNEEKTNWIGIFTLKKARFFSFLPLNHVGERFGIEIPAIWMGGIISFAESLEKFPKNMQDTQPNLFFAVPRIWINFYLGVINKIPEKRLNNLLSLPIISSFLKKKILTTLGFRDLKFAATGAAITPAFIKSFYKKLGIHLIEAYGMTEVAGSITNAPMSNAPLDSVGKAIPDGEVRIHAETGEILMKSPYMMKGYFKNPEKTNEVLKDGWLHSGDKGTLDADGFLRVIGRVKDTFKTSKGSYVTPNPLEEVLAKNTYVEQVCVVGLGIPQPIALFNLSEMGLAVDQKDVENSILSSITTLNASRANYERISTAVIHSEIWSLDNDCLTPTLKVKRFSLDKLFGEKYLAWHESADKVIWL